MLPIVLFGFLLEGCYPGGAEYTSDTDLVITNYNPDFNFGGVTTYFLSDSIQHLVDEGIEPDYSLDPFIISELERNFDALGWERLDSTDAGGNPPDVAIVVTTIHTRNYNIYSWPWYPGWGWGWYWKDSNYWGYPGYGWYYPWPGGAYVTSYDVGSVIWDLFDPDNVDTENEVINVEWTGGLNGVLGSSVSSTKSRITSGINQAFRQSPYLEGRN